MTEREAIKLALTTFGLGMLGGISLIVILANSLNWW